MSVRRPARDQTLPTPEATYLNTLHGPTLHAQCRVLYEAGWPLRAIGEALTPQRSRSTVRSWITKPSPTYIRTVPVSAPKLKTPEAYVPRRPASPGIPAADQTQIQHLAPIARRYRSRMSPRHAAALANDQLTQICVRLHADNVPVQELADAAGVTYRAMYRRLGKTA